VEKETILHGQGRLYRYLRQLKLNSEYNKKEGLRENSIYSFKPIRSTALKENSIGVSQSKILIDATIPFQIKP